jgi:tetratricopeptide (TPR) repeat protein
MPLTPDRMATMSRLLDAALPLDEAGRRRWLEALAPEYHDLLPELRKALLAEFYTALPPATGAERGAAAATGLAPGAHVGPYELIRLLGAGGMAEVWLAKRADGVFKREVALKLPLLTRVRQHFEQRFARERDILAGLEHPHIARLYDAGIDPDGLPYLSMEYVQGRLLTEWCDGECLDIRQRLQLFLQVLEAVQYAHDRHVIHLDIKPSNILVSDTGQSRLLDFGVAKLLEDDAATGQTPLTKVYGHVITAVYASPEVVRGDPVDARSDIYSLGVVLFELLTGVQIAAFGRIRQAITAMGKAVELDPLNAYAWGNMGLFLTMDRDYPAARRALNRALAISPDSDALHFALGELDMLEGEFAHASAEFAKEGNEGARRMSDALLEHARGNETESQHALDDLIAAHAADMAYQVGDVYAWRGDKDEAFEWLERAYRQRDSGLNGIVYDPLLAGLKDDPRYGKLLKELELSN